jgi:hypothetical protein
MGKQRQRYKKYSKYRTDILILAGLLLISMLIRLPLLDYPIDGDVVVYAELTKNIHEKGTLEFEGEIHNKFPPFHAITSTFFYSITKKAALSVKLNSLFFSALAAALLYIICRKHNLNRTNSTLAALLLIFNPWYFYYTAIGSAEGLAIFLLLLGTFLIRFANNRNWMLYAGSLALGLTVVTRSVMITFVVPFAAYFAYTAFKKKIYFRYLVQISLLFIPLALLAAYHFFLSKSVVYGGYSADLSHFMHDAGYIFLIYLVVIPLTFIFLLPTSILSSIKSVKEKFWKLMFACFALYFIVLCLASTNLVAFGVLTAKGIDFSQLPSIFIAQPRYIIPLLPFFILLSLKTDYGKWTRMVRKYLWASMVVFIFFSFILSFGPVQDAIDNKAYFPDTIMRRSAHRAEAIDWLNENADRNSEVSGMLSEPTTFVARMTGLNRFLHESFRKDLTYMPVNSLAEIKQGSYLINGCDEPAAGMQELFKTRHAPHVCVYR